MLQVYEYLSAGRRNSPFICFRSGSECRTSDRVMHFPSLELSKRQPSCLSQGYFIPPPKRWAEALGFCWKRSTPLPKSAGERGVLTQERNQTTVTKYKGKCMAGMATHQLLRGYFLHRQNRCECWPKAWLIPGIPQEPRLHL